MSIRRTKLLTDLFSELQKAEEKHFPIHSLHEASAVILEEYEEFWKLVRDQCSSVPEIYKELLQIAAMCIRTIQDLGINNGL